MDLSRAAWRKSSYSGGTTSNCVEVAGNLRADLTRAGWRKSTYSSGTGSNCVEVAGNLRAVVAVRDTKNRDGGTHLVAAPAWRSFVAAVHRDAFSR